MQITSVRPLEIIEPSPYADKITTCGFLALDQDPKNLNKQIGFALVEVDPDIVGFNIFKVWELALLPLDHEVLFDFILQVNEQKHINRLHVDLENFLWLNGKQQWNIACRQYEANIKEQNRQAKTSQERKPIVKLPSLRPLGEINGEPERGKDLITRQITTLKGVLARAEIQLADHLISDQTVKNELAQVGKSILCDALAGAVYKARDIQRNLRNSFNYQIIKQVIQ